MGDDQDLMTLRQRGDSSNGGMCGAVGAQRKGVGVQGSLPGGDNAWPECRHRREGGKA